jgi:hypothetical protein
MEQCCCAPGNCTSTCQGCRLPGPPPPSVPTFCPKPRSGTGNTQQSFPDSLNRLQQGSVIPVCPCPTWPDLGQHFLTPICFISRALAPGSLLPQQLLHPAPSALRTAGTAKQAGTSPHPHPRYCAPVLLGELLKDRSPTKKINYQMKNGQDLNRHFYKDDARMVKQMLHYQ